MKTNNVQKQNEINRTDSLLPAYPYNTIQTTLNNKFIQTIIKSNYYFIHPSPINTNYTKINSLLLIYITYKYHNLTITEI